MTRLDSRHYGPAIYAMTLWFVALAPAWAQFEARSTVAMPGESVAIATGDFNRDGKLDLVVADSGLSIALGNGDGTFKAPKTYPYLTGAALAVGDFNGDGNLDIVAPYGDGVGVFLGNGDGTFQSPITSATTGDTLFAIATGDFNGDGKLDLAIIDSPYVSVLLGNGDGTFQSPFDNDSFLGPHNLAVGDFNNDHKLDVVVSGYSGGIMGLGVLLGNGDGTLQSSTTYSLATVPNNLAVGDFNHDGKLDVALGGLVAVFLGNGDGTLLPPLHDYFGGSVFVADFNGDGNLDMGIEGFPLGIDMYYGKGDGTFRPQQFYPTGPNGLVSILGDFNGDGKPDVVFLTSIDGANMVLNTGNANFSPASPLVFSNQLVGTVSPGQTVLLTNAGRVPISIGSIKGSGQQFDISSTCQASLPPGAKCKIVAAFAPSGQGTHSGVVTIIDSASSKPQVIELSGTATVVVLSPSSLTFAAQKVGTTSPPQQVELTNTGKIPLSITKLTIAGFDPKDFPESNDCHSSLNAGAGCTITVTFKPTRTGSRTAILYVTDTGGGSPQTVTFSGSGS